MALPAGLTPKTVTFGLGSFFDGTLVDGTVSITAPVNVLHVPTGSPIFSSAMQKKLVAGEATFDLCPTDHPDLNRVDWTYKLTVKISGALVQPDPINFTLPVAGPDTVDLDSLVSVPSSAGTPVSVQVLTATDLDPLTAGYVGDDSSQMSAALRAAFVPMSGKTADLGSTFVVGHRGATRMFPENTIEGYRAVVAAGVKAIAVPVHMTLDGVFVINHDNTFDRTTSYTGGPAIESLPSSKVPQITIQPSKTIVAGYGFPDNIYRPIFLSQVLAEFGHKVNIWVELKSTGTTAANALIALLNEFPALRQSIVVQDFTYADLKLIAAAGYTCQWLNGAGDLASGPTPATAAQMIADGIKWHGPDFSIATDAAVSALVAAGLNVVPYVINTRYLRDHYLGLGCLGVISDDPIYVQATAAMAKTSSFAAASILPGQGSNNENPTSGHGRGYYTNGKLQIDAAGPTFILQGLLSPIPGVGLATGQVTFPVTVDAVGTDTSRNIVVCLTKDDRPENSTGGTPATPDGYYALIKPNGTVNVYRDVAGARAGVGGAAASALSTGQTFTVTVSWTASGITFTFNGGSVSDTSAQRLTGPMYLHLGKDGGASASDTGLLVSYGDPVVTP